MKFIQIPPNYRVLAKRMTVASRLDGPELAPDVSPDRVRPTAAFSIHRAQVAAGGVGVAPEVLAFTQETRFRTKEKAVPYRPPDTALNMR